MRNLLLTGDGFRGLFVPCSRFVLKPFATNGVTLSPNEGLAHARPSAKSAVPPCFWRPRRLTARPFHMEGDHKRSEERRVGKECVSTFRSRGSPSLSKKNTQ